MDKLRDIELQDKSKIEKFYSQKVLSLSDEIRNYKLKGRTLVVLELLFFCLAVAALVLYCFRWHSLAMAISLFVFLVLYIIVRLLDITLDKLIDHKLRQRIVYEKEIKYLRGDFSQFDSGEQYVDSCHPFTFDLDIFGKDSLFNRICRATTSQGKDHLASFLSHLLLNKEEILLRREAIKELQEMEAWRNDFLAYGQSLQGDKLRKKGIIDTGAILNMIRSADNFKISSYALNPLVMIIAVLMLIGLYITILLSIFSLLPSSVPITWAIVQLFIVLTMMSGPLRNISKIVGRLNAQLNPYVLLIEHINNAEFKSKELLRIKNFLFLKDSNALSSFRRLADIVNRLDSRGNVLGLILMNIFLLSDFFLVRRFLFWKATYMDKIPQWMDLVSSIDALVSMANFNYNEPKTIVPKIIDSEDIVFQAKQLYHPFLGEKAVSNDFEINDGHYYIITGANMAGKSTFLRTIGINYVLAMCGMNVFANGLTISVFNLFTSMRTMDDLNSGISYFNAELLRLRKLMDSCAQSSRTLIILDEILKGTNSLDKLNGSRLFLEHMSNFAVTGIIATHDLELSKMEKDRPERFQNWCFEIGLGQDVTYTYKITPGVAQNQNATFLLKNMIDSSSILSK